MNFFRLIRASNLAIILLTQGILFFGFIQPVFKLNGIESEMKVFGFIQMFSITAIITICGYLINDLIDAPVDYIKHQGRQLANHVFSLTWIRRLYIILFILGFILSFQYAWKHSVLSLFYIYPAISALLAFYSSHLKGFAYAGNIVVSLLSSGVAGIVLLFERAQLSALQNLNSSSYETLISLISAFIIFAFISSLYREMVKDIEDFEGDRSFGLYTGAVLLGVKKAKIPVIGTGILLIVSISAWMYHDLNQGNTIAIVFGGLIVIFVLLSIFKIFKAKLPHDFRAVSLMIKGIMFLGLVYLFIYTFQFQ